MINKRGLWFLTLFSLILVLSVYYITMPNDMFKTNNSEVELKKESKSAGDTKDVITELSAIDVMREEAEDERESTKKTYEETISSTKTTTSEKNQAYESLKQLNDNKSIEKTLEEKIKNKLELDSFVKKESNNIIVTIEKKDHNKELAMEIMQLVQDEFKEQVVVSVKFIS